MEKNDVKNYFLCIHGKILLYHIYSEANNKYVNPTLHVACYLFLYEWTN